MATRVAVLGTVAISRAGDMDTEVFRLIGPEINFANGLDVERYQRSALSHYFPPYWDRSRGVRHAIGVSADRNGRGWEVLKGDDSWPEDPGQTITVYHDVPVLVLGQSALARLDRSTQLFAALDDVGIAIDRWLSPNAPPTEFGEQARRLSASFDGWFLVSHPLEWLGDAEQLLGTKFGPDFAKRILEVRGGFRLGSTNQVVIEAVTDSSEDAFVLAALARWLPGFVQSIGSGSEASRVLNLVEDFAVHSQGRVVTVSFIIPESRIRELAEAELEQRNDVDLH